MKNVYWRPSPMYMKDHSKKTNKQIRKELLDMKNQKKPTIVFSALLEIHKRGEKREKEIFKWHSKWK